MPEVPAVRDYADALTSCVIMTARMKHSQDQAKLRTDLDPVIEAYKKDIDRTLIRENLRLTVDQRFRQLMELQRFAEELQNSGRKACQKQ